jgi:hypothetical protein
MQQYMVKYLSYVIHLICGPQINVETWYRIQQKTPTNPTKVLFTSLVFSPLKDVGICGDLAFTQYSQIPSNTLPQKYFIMMESFLSSQKYTRVEGICGDIPRLSPQNPD